MLVWTNLVTLFLSKFLVIFCSCGKYAVNLSTKPGVRLNMQSIVGFLKILMLIFFQFSENRKDIKAKVRIGNGIPP